MIAQAFRVRPGSEERREHNVAGSLISDVNKLITEGKACRTLGSPNPFSGGSGATLSGRSVAAQPCALDSFLKACSPGNIVQTQTVQEFHRLILAPHRVEVTGVRCS